MDQTTKSSLSEYQSERLKHLVLIRHTPDLNRRWCLPFV